MIVRTNMNAQAINETIEELNAERRLALKKGEIDRACILLAAIKRIYAELDREQRRPTADPSTRAA